MRFTAIQSVSLLCLITVSVFSLGCTSTTGRIYSGDALKPNEVALIELGRGCSIGELIENEKPRGYFGPLTAIEVLPGSYDLAVGYFASNSYAYSNSYAASKGPVHVAIHAQPGHVYFIYPDLSIPHSWKPIVVDISRDEDFAKVDDREHLKKRVDSYFKEARPHVVPLSTTVQK
jgi:hypothetical protein